MQSLEEVSNHIPEELRAQVTKLTLENAVQGVWTRDDLVKLPSLHTVVFNHRSVCHEMHIILSFFVTKEKYKCFKKYTTYFRV